MKTVYGTFEAPYDAKVRNDIIADSEHDIVRALKDNHVSKRG